MNYDQVIPKQNDIERKKNHFLLPKHPFRMLITGASGTGKTNIFMTLLNQLLDYDNLYVVSPSLNDQPIYQHLIDLSNQSDSIKCYDDIAQFNLEDVRNENTNLIVFDDCMCEKKLAPLIEKSFSWGRHKNASIFYLSQSFFTVPKNIRLNCTQYIIFPLGDTNEIIMIHRRIAPDLKLEQFLEIYKNAIDEPYSFLFVDKMAKDRALAYRKRFDQLLIN